MKKVAIIVKFKDRPVCDLLYSNKLKLTEKSINGYRNETSIYINKPLPFDAKKLCSTSEANPEHLATT